MGLTQKSIEMTDNVPKCDTFVAYDISPTFYIYAGVSQITDFSLLRIGL